jgi:hypothetical protein
VLSAVQVTREERMGFELFDKRAAGRTKVPTITIQRKGTMSVNAAAAFLITGGAEIPKEMAVELLFDREKKIVGVRKAVKEHPSVYTLRKQKNSDSYLLGGRAFTQFYGIDTTESRRYAARKYDGDVVGVDLNDQFQTVTRGETEEGEVSEE